jgi:hypothetical protein
MPDDPFDSPRAVLQRARDHIDDLEARIKAFFDRKPYARVIDFDREASQQVHKIRLTAKIPGNLAVITKDVLSNLRDALDHAVYASAVMLGNKSPQKTGFPFAYDAAGVHNKLNKELIDVPSAIRSLLEALRPHKGGDETLWGLNAVRNTKTHKMLVPLGAASISGSTEVITGQVIGPTRMGYHRWDASKNEVEYMRLGPGSEVYYKFTASFDVLFGNVEVFGGRQATSTLRVVANEVERILGAIEAETRRVLAATS